MKVSEIFASIQGEGRFVGLPQVFVRLAGCNLRCSWCDTEYALKDGEDMSINEVVEEIQRFGLTSVCITGGEPMLQVKEIRQLISSLKGKGYSIVLETNGTTYDEDVFNLVNVVACDMKPPSSGQKSDESILKRLDEKDYVKIVIQDEGDYEFAKRIISKSPVEVILQPERVENTEWLIGRVLEDRLTVRIVPQVHKMIGVK
ncbi:7-carboxy-7-deazaguanine synthase QueE [Candidatus Altiarchaeota archaeon]